MTTPNIPAGRRYGSDQESMGDWVLLHKRSVTWAVLALAAIVAGFWFYQRSQSIKAQRAESAYFQARQSAAAGNLPLAISDLQKVVTRYEGTRAGTQAAISLAEARFDQKKFKEGIATLKQVEAKAPEDFRPSIHVLEAAGYEELKDFVAAAEQYNLAAKTTVFPVDKAKYRASAARDFMAAGKTEEATKIWTELAKDESTPEAAEARVRLGELTAKPMKI
ncbi:MAG TPA: tetratricopeptide repeat protein [Gemmatimonadaceae bacterium]|nr:tetratricopeptide repeat protein [Gemmatimonadaceae bacterium]